MKQSENKIEKLELKIEESETKIELKKKALETERRLELKAKKEIILKIEKLEAKIKIFKKKLREIEEKSLIRALLICQEIHNNNLDLLKLKQLKSTTNNK